MLQTNVKVEPFDPANSTWSRWVERLEMAFDIMQTTNENKQKFLLHYISMDSYNVLCDKLAPEKPQTKTYAEIETLLKTHYEPAPLEIVENYKFHLRKQADGEKVADFVVALRRLSIHCNFGAYLETALRNQLVFGLRQQKVQNRLLETKGLTLEKAVDMATAMEASERGGAEMHQTKTEPVNLVNQRTKQRQGGRSNASNGANGTSSGCGADKSAAAVKCYRCGGTSHVADKCRYIKTECNKCHTRGHLARVCRKGDTQKAPNHVSIIEELAHISSRATDKLNVELNVNNCLLSFEIDTGAPVTIIAVGDAKRLFPKLKIHPSDRRLASYCGREIKVFGYAVVDVNVGSHCWAASGWRQCDSIGRKYSSAAKLSKLSTHQAKSMQ